MALIESSAIRRDDSAGKAIKTFLDGDGDHIQAVALVDESGDQTGIAGNSQNVTEDNFAALLTELQLKADLSETQPISAADLPLPAGASTEASLTSLLTELQLKANLTETQPVSAAALPLPAGASTEATLLALLAELMLKADLTEAQPISMTDENGVAYGIKHVDNKMRTSTKPYLYEIAEGLIAGHEAVRKFGFNPNVSTSWETVCGTSALANYLTAAEHLQIASDEADDDGDPGGTGARTVLVSGLDANYDPLSETVIMNGVANVLTDASFLRVLCLSVVTAGATGSNKGTITASNNADTAVLQQIEPTENQCLCAAYTVRDGYKLYVVQGAVTEGSTKGSQVAFWQRPFGGLWTIARTNILLDSGVIMPMPLPMLVAAKTDIELRCKGVLAGAAVSAGFEGWIETV